MSNVWKKRYISTKFRDDNYIIDLDPIEKLLFLYFLSNTLTNVAWVYEISIRRIAFDTWIDKDMVLKIIDRFSKKDKIYYIDWYIIIKNSLKHQNLDNAKIKKWIENVLDWLPDNILSMIDKDYTPIKNNNNSWWLIKTLNDSWWLKNNSDLDSDLDSDSDEDKKTKVPEKKHTRVKSYLDNKENKWSWVFAVLYVFDKLWYKPAKNETLESFKERFKDSLEDYEIKKEGEKKFKIRLKEFLTYWEWATKKKREWKIWKTTLLNNFRTFNY